MKPACTLFEGFRQVEEFGPQDEYESEEEVCYVTLDLGEIEPSLVPSATTYRLIGLDSPTPYLQLQGTVFKGRHDSLLGTELLFADDKDTQEWNKRSVTHLANVEKRIVFKEVTLVPQWTTNTTTTTTGQHSMQRAPSEDGTTTAGPSTLGQPQIDFSAPAGLEPSTSTSTIDRMTGMAPQAVSKRGRRPGRGKGTGSARRGGRSKKGKEKALPEDMVDNENEVEATQDVSMADDTMDDMYLDE